MRSVSEVRPSVLHQRPLLPEGPYLRHHQALQEHLHLRQMPCNWKARHWWQQKCRHSRVRNNVLKAQECQYYRPQVLHSTFRLSSSSRRRSSRDRVSLVQVTLRRTDHELEACCNSHSPLAQVLRQVRSSLHTNDKKNTVYLSWRSRRVKTVLPSQKRSDAATTATILRKGQSRTATL